MSDTPAATSAYDSDWQPVADHDMLRRRAGLLADIRAFMAERDILEVETPQLTSTAVSDPALESLSVGEGVDRRYLQTSPEFAMKRLLAAGSGPIYQIARVFRDLERGRLHHPEFTMLEWYRPGFRIDDMLAEVDALLETLQLPPAVCFSYAELFMQALSVDPHVADRATLQCLVDDRGYAGSELSHCQLLDFLFSDAVMPLLRDYRTACVQDFPVQQAALARIRDDQPPVAERFELFIDGIEIGNGFRELTDVVEQRRRFLADQTERRRRGLPTRPIDEYFLAALAAGMPDSCGLAIGVDRLLMLLSGSAHIDDVLAFPCERS